MAKSVSSGPAEQSVASPTAEGFERSMGLVSNFSLGFTYLSPLAGLCALLPLGLMTAGAPALWWLLIVAAGQMLVALVFGEVVSQYPLTGGIYPWTRRLWGARYAWLAAWVYICALVVTITSAAEFSVPYFGSLFGFTPTRGTSLLVAVVLLLVTLAANLSGTRTLGRVARAGFFAEIIGVVAYGFYLLVFERHNSFSVFFDTMNVSGDGSYFNAFLMASITGLFLFYGFEACADVAEEVKNPRVQIPRAMILTIVFGGISALTAFIGFTLAAPDLPAIVSGEVADPVTAILQNAFGTVGTKIFLVIALTSFTSAVLSLQSALSRLIFAFARDRMLPGSAVLGTLAGDRTARNAMLVACAAPMLVCLWVYAQPDNLARVTAFAVLGIYLCFQMVVLASLRQRLRGWKPAGPFSLGRAGLPVNVAALVYGVAAMIVLARPGDASQAFLDRYVVLIGLAIVLGSGLLYMVLAHPWGESNAPEGDALEVAADLRTDRGAVVSDR